VIRYWVTGSSILHDDHSRMFVSTPLGKTDVTQFLSWTFGQNFI
jgi:hypothetical protein